VGEDEVEEGWQLGFCALKSEDLVVGERKHPLVETSACTRLAAFYPGARYYLTSILASFSSSFRRYRPFNLSLLRARDINTNGSIAERGEAARSCAPVIAGSGAAMNAELFMQHLRSTLCS